MQPQRESPDQHSWKEEEEEKEAYCNCSLYLQVVRQTDCLIHFSSAWKLFAGCTKHSLASRFPPVLIDWSSQTLLTSIKLMA
jgi:hypothetical protein